MPKAKKGTAVRRKHAAIASLAAAEAAKRRKIETSACTSATSAPAAATTHTSSPPAETSSKLRKSLVLEQTEKTEAPGRRRMIIDEETVEEIVKSVVCANCASDKVDVKFTHHQIDTYVEVKCDECGHVIVDTYKRVSVKQKNFHPLSMLLVYYTMLLGVGFDGADKLMSFFSLHHFNITTYIRYAKHITEHAVRHTHSVLEKCRAAVYDHYKNKLDVNVTAEGKVNVEAGFDGSWHRRGHKSNFGIGSAIEMDTGLVLDYYVCSKLCNLCIAKEKQLKGKKITETDYVMWLEEHLDKCDANYEGSSGGMEAEAAVKMWGRSSDHMMLYTTLLSDGDSSTYLAVRAMNGGQGPYGDGQMVEKPDCINHVAKRLGTALRALKKKGKSMGGRNKLTDTVIDHLQYYFQVSLNRKVGTSVSEMRDEIMSSIYHCTSTDDKPQHDKCTKGIDSWCFYNKSLALGETPKSHAKMKVHFHLPDEQLKQIKSIYERLTTDEMMTRCMKGMTQNRNEHIHSRIWRICPKHRPASKRMVDFATATAVCNFNVGYAESHLADSLGIETTLSMQRYLTEKDKAMDAPWKRKRRNKKLRRELEYAAGGF